MIENYTVDSLLKMAARYEADGQRTLARVVFEDAMILDATYRIAARKWVANEEKANG